MRPILEFEFCLNTGNSPLVCCRQPVYGFHENKIMTKQIADLEANGLITNCEGSWGSLLLLTANPRQERCDDINTIILKLCVSYRLLNRITLGFEFSTLRYIDSIEDLGVSRGSLFVISLNTRSSYYQNRARESDQE